MTINNTLTGNIRRTQEESESSQLNKKSKNESSQETAQKVNEVVQEQPVFTGSSPHHQERSSSTPSALHNTSNQEEDNSYSLQLTSSPLDQGSPHKEEGDSDQEGQEDEPVSQVNLPQLRTFPSYYRLYNPVIMQNLQAHPTLLEQREESEGSHEEESSSPGRPPYPIRRFSPNQLLVDDPIEDEGLWGDQRDESMGHIKSEIANCFSDEYDKKFILNANDLEKLISVIGYNFFDYKNTHVITDTFIENLYQSLLLLQNREREDIFQKSEALGAIEDLYHSLILIKNYPDFEAIKRGRLLYKKENPNIYLTPIREQLKEPLGRLYRQIINEAPLYTMRDWTGQDEQPLSYILGKRKDIYPWIFKPEWASPNLFETKKSSLYASAMNFHRGFPILDTFLIRTKNITGQLDHVILEAEPLSNFVDRSIFSRQFCKKIESLLIFDLLFCNTNRDFTNILTINLGVIYGVNHETCFKIPSESRSELKLDYWWLAAYENGVELFFDAETLELISLENCRRYQQILRSFELSPQLIEWVGFIGEVLRRDGEQKSIKALIEKIKTEFQQFFYPLSDG